MERRDSWYSDSDYEARGGKIVMMSPAAFLSRTRPLKIDEASRDNIDDLKRLILSGRPLDPLKRVLHLKNMRCDTAKSRNVNCAGKPHH